MGQILRGSAKTTHVVRAAIQRSKASIKVFAKCYDLNPKTVTKWKKRPFVHAADGAVPAKHRRFPAIVESFLFQMMIKHRTRRNKYHPHISRAGWGIIPPRRRSCEWTDSARSSRPGNSKSVLLKRGMASRISAVCAAMSRLGKLPFYH
jgi:hypothetical protein